MRRIAVSSLLAVSLWGCSHAPSTPPAAPAPPSASKSNAAPPPAPAASSSAPPAANAVDPAVVQALQNMGKYLQTLRTFEAQVDLSGERVLQDGQKLLHMATAKVDVQRPNMLRAEMRSARSARDLIYDGKTVVLYLPEQKYYSKAPFTDNLDELGNRLQERYGIELPVADLFLWGTPQAPLGNMTSAMNAGQDVVDGEVCDHYAFRQDNVDWQIWIATGARPLPRKLVITNRADEARPQSVSLIRWRINPGFNASRFAFTPPQGATEAKFVPLKSQ